MKSESKDKAKENANEIKSIADLPETLLELDDFDYELPSELIAHEPLQDRSSSRLMVLDKTRQQLEHTQTFQLPDYLRAGDSLVLNNTKVIPARFVAERQSGGKVEILLIKSQAGMPGAVWQSMANPLRKLKSGDWLSVRCQTGKIQIQVVEICQSEEGQNRVLLDFRSQEKLMELLGSAGEAPLPPYIRRRRRELRQEKQCGAEGLKDLDLQRYQTVYAAIPGAVAAPTAGLHFSKDLLEQIKSMGVSVHYLTLHVGPGTFKPLSGPIGEHSIEAEEFSISYESAAALNNTKKQGGRVIAVGTTSCRALESASENGILEAVEQGSSRLYIKPGYKFKFTDALLTNFHLPKSSLLLLVSAFAGHSLTMCAYKEAIEKKYRFYSFGDAMFIH